MANPYNRPRNCTMTKTQIIESLGLEPHPMEGGYFRRTYESSQTIGSRKLLTSIYYLLSDDSPIGYMHRNKSDILHFHHSGSSIKYLLISDDGTVEEHLLGSNLEEGEKPQLLVKGGVWKISILQEGSYGLLSEAVCPGFEYADNELAGLELVQARFPELAQEISIYVKES